MEHTWSALLYNYNEYIGHIHFINFIYIFTNFLCVLHTIDVQCMHVHQLSCVMNMADSATSLRKRTRFANVTDRSCTRADECESERKRFCSRRARLRQHAEFMASTALIPVTVLQCLLVAAAEFAQNISQGPLYDTRRDSQHQRHHVAAFGALDNKVHAHDLRKCNIYHRSTCRACRDLSPMSGFVAGTHLVTLLDKIRAGYFTLREFTNRHCTLFERLRVLVYMEWLGSCHQRRGAARGLHQLVYLRYIQDAAFRESVTSCPKACRFVAIGRNADLRFERKVTSIKHNKIRTARTGKQLVRVWGMRTAADSVQALHAYIFTCTWTCYAYMCMRVLSSAFTCALSESCTRPLPSTAPKVRATPVTTRMLTMTILVLTTSVVSFRIVRTSSEKQCDE